MDTTTNLATQMREDYLAYSMAVLVGRAIPDLYDGLKPVQRRVLQTMLEEGLLPDKRYVKSARVTGLTMGYYHPHSGAYGALVNMATSWNNNVPWIDGHGNFGSTVDGPAAERYTECRLRESAVELLLQDRSTWVTRDNYDASRQEAVRFNSAVPAVLLNGDTGIAVGFATKLAPHSLRDVAEATTLVAQGKVAEARKLLVPDFPTGCDIVEDDELTRYRESGSGNIRCRAKMEVGEVAVGKRKQSRATLAFTHLPPGVNPEKVGEQIKTALEKGTLDNIAEVIDESDLSGDRVTVVLKPGGVAAEVASRLYTYTDLDTKYSAKTLVIDGVHPVELSPAEVCQRWVTWRLERLKAQFAHERDLKELRLEIVMGLLKALTRLDAVIAVIRSAATPKEALIELVTNRSLKFTREQAQAVLDMRLRSLTGLDAEALEAERVALEGRLEVLTALVASEADRTKHLVAEVKALGKRHGEARRSALTLVEARVRSERGPSAPRVAKPRYVVVDTKKGVVTQGRGPRGAMIFEPGDKLIVVTQDGTLRKLPATFKGPVAATFQPTLLARKEADIADRRYLVVFTLGGALRAMVVTGVELSRTTSRGKTLVPEGSTVVHLAEATWVVPWRSGRRKELVLGLDTVKVGRPGGRGVKVAALEEVALG